MHLLDEIDTLRREAESARAMAAMSATKLRGTAHSFHSANPYVIVVCCSVLSDVNETLTLPQQSWRKCGKRRSKLIVYGASIHVSRMRSSQRLRPRPVRLPAEQTIAENRLRRGATLNVRLAVVSLAGQRRSLRRKWHRPIVRSRCVRLKLAEFVCSC